MPKKINDLREDIYNEYIKIFENNKNPLVEIEVISEKYQLSVERIIKFLMDYITETKNPKEDYATIFDNVLACGRKSKKFYDYLDELDVNFEYLKTNLTNYFIYYRPDILLTSPRKKQILEKDLSDYERHLKDKEQTNIFETQTLQESYQVLREFIQSPYNIERFCLKNKLSTSVFNNKNSTSYVVRARKHNPELYNAYIENLNKKNNLLEQNGKNIVFTILYFIKTLPDFSLVDFFQITEFDPSSIVNIANTYLKSKEDLHLFRATINNIYSDFVIHGRIYNDCSPKSIIDTPYRYTKNGTTIETKSEEREEVINFIINLGLPLNASNFNISLERYFDNRLYNQNYNIESIYLEYIKRVKESSNSKIDITLLAKDFNLSLKETLKRITYYINNVLEKTNEEELFDEIISEAINKNNLDFDSYLFQKGITPQVIKDNFYNYLVLKRPDILYNDNIISKIKTFINNYGLNYSKINDDMKKIQNAKSIIEELINSGYSIDRFCSKKELTVKDFKNIVKIFELYFKNTPLYNNFITYLDYFLDEDNLKEALDLVLKTIKNPNYDFTYLDFFLLTKYSVNEIIKMADKCLNQEDSKLIRSKATLGKSKLANYKHENLRKIELLHTAYSFNLDGDLIETTSIDREKIIDFLNSLYIPIQNKTFYDALKRYYNSTIEVSKQY